MSEIQQILLLATVVTTIMVLLVTGAILTGVTLARDDLVAQVRGETAWRKLGSDAGRPTNAADKFVLEAYDADSADYPAIQDRPTVTFSGDPDPWPDPIVRMHDRDEDGTHETLELLHEGEVVRVFVYDPERGWEETTGTP